jgi:hypothetical protein
MEKPKSVEATRIIAFEFYQRCGQHKGKPAARKMQEKVMKAIEACEDWTKSDNPQGRQGFIFPEAAPEPEGDAITPTEGKALEQWGLRQREWLNKTIFIELDRKARAFLWKTFYAQMFEEEITPADQKHIERIAKVLGKTGALDDMKTDIEDWEDEEDEETEGSDGDG